MQTIYVDVLIILNIYVNYFILRITAWLTHSRLKIGRCIGAAAYGSVFSLLILIPCLPAILMLVIKTAAAISIAAIAFSIRSIKRLIKDTLVFLVVNILLAGAVYAVYSWLKPAALHFNNSYFYIDFSLIVLIATTAALYIAVRIGYILSAAKAGQGSYTVIIRYHGKSVSVSGLADTGNALIDHFSGSPVIICDKICISELVGEIPCIDDLPRGFRIIPCSTVSDSGLIPVFRPDEIIICNTDDGAEKNVDALIGLGMSGGEAIFNPKLLKL